MIVGRLSPDAIQIGWALDWLGIILWDLEVFRCCIVSWSVDYNMLFSHIFKIELCCCCPLKELRRRSSHCKQQIVEDWMPIGNIYIYIYIYIYIWVLMCCSYILTCHVCCWECVIMALRIHFKKKKKKALTHIMNNDKSIWMDGFEVSLCNCV
jgi:hypothetical protein